MLGNHEELFLGLTSAREHSCEAKISGSIVQDALALSAFRSSVTALDSTRSDLTLDKLTLMNASLFIGNNLTVTDNSTLIDSAIHRYSGPLYSAEGAVSGQPRVTFLANVYTGFDIFNAEELEKVSKSFYFHLLKFPARLIFDGIGIIIAKSLELSTPRVSQAFQPSVHVSPFDNGDENLSSEKMTLNVQVYNDAFINITEEASMAVYSHTFIEALKMGLLELSKITAR